MNSNYILSNVLPQTKPFSIVTPLERKSADGSQFPWSSIGLLKVCNDNGCSYGTGFMFENDIFITAKHNFTAIDDYTSIAVCLGYNANNIIYAVYPPVYHRTLDFAVLLIHDCNVKPLNIYGQNAIINTKISICGYGEPVISSSLSSSEGKIIENANGKLKYNASTNKGDSGAPVITMDYSVVAIHTNSGNGNWNEGILLSQEIISEIKNIASHIRGVYSGK